MIDPKQAILYIKDVVTQLELKEDEIHKEELSLEGRKKQLILDREALTGRESAFLSKVDGHGVEVERITKMGALAKKMKAKVDDDRLILDAQIKELDTREAKITKLEEREKSLDEREKTLLSKEIEVEEREVFIERDKQALREKKEFLDIKVKSIKAKQEKLQNMIEMQKI